jgi:hypothetical protein
MLNSLKAVPDLVSERHRQMQRIDEGIACRLAGLPGLDLIDAALYAEADALARGADPASLPVLAAHGAPADVAARVRGRDCARRGLIALLQSMRVQAYEALEAASDIDKIREIAAITIAGLAAANASPAPALPMEHAAAHPAPAPDLAQIESRISAVENAILALAKSVAEITPIVQALQRAATV